MQKMIVQTLFVILVFAGMGSGLPAQAHPVCNTSGAERSMKKIRFVSDHPNSPMTPVGLYVSKNKSFIQFRTFLDKKSYPAIFVSIRKGDLAIPYHVCENTAIIDRKINTGRITLWFHHSPIEITPSRDESTRKASEQTPKE